MSNIKRTAPTQPQFKLCFFLFASQQKPWPIGQLKNKGSYNDINYWQKFQNHCAVITGTAKDSARTSLGWCIGIKMVFHWYLSNLSVRLKPWHAYLMPFKSPGHFFSELPGICLLAYDLSRFERTIYSFRCTAPEYFGFHILPPEELNSQSDLLLF